MLLLVPEVSECATEQYAITCKFLSHYKGDFSCLSYFSVVLLAENYSEGL